MRKLTFLCFIFSVLTTYGCAQAPQQQAPNQLSEEELEAQVDQLLGKMVSNEYKEREEATKKLRKLLRDSGRKRKLLAEYAQKRLEESEDFDLRYRLELILDRYLRPWKCFKRIDILEKEGDCVFRRVAFSPDGKLVACAGYVLSNSNGKFSDYAAARSAPS